MGTAWRGHGYKSQALGDLFGQAAEIEDALIAVVSIGRHLLERLDQLGGVFEIGDQLRRRLAADLRKFGLIA